MKFRTAIFILLFAMLIPIAIRMVKNAMPMSTKQASQPSAAIVIGTGLAGLSAASTLLSHNIPILVLDRSPKPGGNSIKASSGINGAPTPYQDTLHPDTTFYTDTTRSAGSLLASSQTPSERKWRESLIATLVKDSSDAIAWLTDKGVDLSHVAQLGGHTAARTHRGAGTTPPGYAIVSTLLASLKSNPNCTLSSSSRVMELLQDSQHHVIGVRYVAIADDAGGVEGAEASEIERQAFGPVVIASGGFAGDSHGLLARYRPDLAGLPSTNEERPGSADLLTGVGARLVDMQSVQVHPTAFVDPKVPENANKFLAAEMLRGEGGVLLRGVRGERFVNEMETRKVVSEAIMGEEGKTVGALRVWDVDLVMDQGAYEVAKAHVDFYLWKGLMHKGTVAELGPDAVASLQAYADAAAGKGPDPFGRASFGHWKIREVTPETVVYIGKVTPAIHFTMGGVAINENAEVLDEKGEKINGIWAAGEVTGGLHGDNRLGGNALLESVVFGRKAGEGAAIAFGQV
jgi:flavocytochrome c